MYITVIIHYNDITKHYIGRAKTSPDHLMVPFPPHFTHCRHYYGRNQTLKKKKKKDFENILLSPLRLYCGSRPRMGNLSWSQLF